MKRITILGSLLLVSLFLSSCIPLQALGVNLTNTPTIVPSPTATQTSTPVPTFTATPTSTNTPTPVPVIIPNTGSDIPCDQAAFIEDVTIPDGTDISAGSIFTKTWQLQNTGGCPWTPAYRVVFDHGALLDAPASFNIPSYVNPGQIVDISVNLTAPYVQGIYEGFWKLEDPNGNFFGVGASSVDFDEEIAVGNIPASFDVRRVDMSVNNGSVTAVCPPGYPFTITAEIWTNGGGDVNYRWEFSDGTRSDEHTLHFGNARRKSVSTTFTADQTGVYSALIHVLGPNERDTDKIYFSLTCTPVPLTSTPIPPTNTPIPPTPIAVPPTRTPLPPTSTPIPPTKTTVPPTRTPVPPTNTPIPPTSTVVPPTPTAIQATNTPVPTTPTPVVKPTETKRPKHS
jgi:hypothetical protein